MRKNISTTSGLIIIVIISLFPIIYFFLFKEITLDTIYKEKVFSEKEKNKYTIIFAGDIMLDRGVRIMTEKNGGDYSFPFLRIKEVLEKADILFGNLEGPISDKGKNIGSIYSFRANLEAVKGLIYAGFNVLSLSNNHAFDYGREAFEDTMTRLKENKISYTGGGFNTEEAHNASIINLNDNLKVGFLGYTEFLYPNAFASKNKSGITILSDENIKRDIEKAKEELDFLVVTFHYGNEYEKESNNKQKELSRKAIDYGADIVIGHHPHVTQEIEIYKDKYIVYSLGNFVFDQYFSKETMEGFILKIIIEGNKIKLIEKINYNINDYYQPELKSIEKIKDSI